MRLRVALCGGKWKKRKNEKMRKKWMSGWEKREKEKGKIEVLGLGN